MALWSEVIFSAYRWAKPAPFAEVKGISLVSKSLERYLDETPCSGYHEYFHPVKPDDLCPICNRPMAEHRFISPKHLYIPFELNSKVKLNTICRVCPGNYVLSVVSSRLTIVNADLMNYYIASIQKE